MRYLMFQGPRGIAGRADLPCPPGRPRPPGPPSLVGPPVSAYTPAVDVPAGDVLVSDIFAGGVLARDVLAGEASAVDASAANVPGSGTHKDPASSRFARFCRLGLACFCGSQSGTAAGSLGQSLRLQTCLRLYRSQD